MVWLTGYLAIMGTVLEFMHKDMTDTKTHEKFLEFLEEVVKGTLKIYKAKSAKSSKSIYFQ